MVTAEAQINRIAFQVSVLSWNVENPKIEEKVRENHIGIRDTVSAN